MATFVVWVILRTWMIVVRIKTLQSFVEIDAEEPHQEVKELNRVEQEPVVPTKLWDRDAT